MFYHLGYLVVAYSFVLEKQKFVFMLKIEVVISRLHGPATLCALRRLMRKKLI